jgi:hypothetical protein
MGKQKKGKNSKKVKKHASLTKATSSKVSNCKKHYTAKCNSELLMKAYRKIKLTDGGLKGKGGTSFSKDQRRRALQQFAVWKSGAKYTPQYKAKVKRSRDILAKERAKKKK